jgi:hypothetical protein
MEKIRQRERYVVLIPTVRLEDLKDRDALTRYNCILKNITMHIRQGAQVVLFLRADATETDLVERYVAKMYTIEKYTPSVITYKHLGRSHVGFARMAIAKFLFLLPDDLIISINDDRRYLAPTLRDSTMDLDARMTELLDYVKMKSPCLVGPVGQRVLKYTSDIFVESPELLMAQILFGKVGTFKGIYRCANAAQQAQRAHQAVTGRPFQEFKEKAVFSGLFEPLFEDSTFMNAAVQCGVPCVSYTRLKRLTHTKLSFARDKSVVNPSMILERNSAEEIWQTIKHALNSSAVQPAQAKSPHFQLHWGPATVVRPMKLSRTDGWNMHRFYLLIRAYAKAHVQNYGGSMLDAIRFLQAHIPEEFVQVDPEVVEEQEIPYEFTEGAKQGKTVRIRIIYPEFSKTMVWPLSEDRTDVLNNVAIMDLGGPPVHGITVTQWHKWDKSEDIQYHIIENNYNWIKEALKTANKALNAIRIAVRDGVNVHALQVEQGLTQVKLKRPQAEVEQVLDRKDQGGSTLKYLIKWKGHPLSQSTWETREQLLDKGMIQNYEKKRTKANRWFPWTGVQDISDSQEG